MDIKKRTEEILYNLNNDSFINCLVKDEEQSNDKRLKLELL